MEILLIYSLSVNKTEGEKFTEGISKSNQEMEVEIKTILTHLFFTNNTAQRMKFNATSNPILKHPVLSTVGLPLLCIIKKNMQIECHLRHRVRNIYADLRCKYKEKRWGGAVRKHELQYLIMVLLHLSYVPWPVGILNNEVYKNVKAVCT